MGKTRVLGAGDYEALQSAFQAANLDASLLIGFGRSGSASLSIANGQTTHTSPAIFDFTFSWGFLVVRFTDCERVQSGAKLRVDVSMGAADTMCRVYDSIQQSRDLATIPNGAGETMQIVIPHAMGFRRVKVHMSLAASGGAVPIELYGLDLVKT